jgi:hypothetical protein
MKEIYSLNTKLLNYKYKDLFRKKDYAFNYPHPETYNGVRTNVRFHYIFYF